MNNKFCCRFNTTDGMMHPKWISGEELTLQCAKAWAEKQAVKEGFLFSVDEVYQVNNDDYCESSNLNNTD